MRYIVFENHRKDKTSEMERISVVTKTGTVESGWSCGRTQNELEEDFGIENTNWFRQEHSAHAYVIKNGLDKK